MQRAYVMAGSAAIPVELPPATAEVVPGVTWGAVEAFPTPAYWAYQVFARRIEGTSINYKLGRSLKEEIGACILGGHGIPARVGLAAFEHLKALGAFEAKCPTEEQLASWLNLPISCDGRQIRYRFVSQKSRYLAGALQAVQRETPPQDNGRRLRDWLLQLPGIGLKTASWISRNWVDADDVAIIDIHLYRAGVIAGFFDAGLSIERDYLELEKRFLTFSKGLGVRASELDAVIWLEMMKSPLSVASILSAIPEAVRLSNPTVLTLRPKNRSTDSRQLALLA